jgi:heterodisulfide reductase subunit C
VSAVEHVDQTGSHTSKNKTEPNAIYSAIGFLHLGKNIKHNQATNEKQVFEKRKTLETIKWLGNSTRSSLISFPQFNAK